MNKNRSQPSGCKSFQSFQSFPSSKPCTSLQTTLQRPLTASSSTLPKRTDDPNKANSFKTFSSKRPSTASQPALSKRKSISSSRLKDPQQSPYLLSALKSYIVKPSPELVQVQKEIPKFNARKIQDLKKGYKFNEDFDALASSFLSVFAEIDQELKKEMISLRMKIGEYLISYFSNSGKFIKILKGMTETLKNLELAPKALADAARTLGLVKRERLSTNYQDLHDLLAAMVKFFRRKKSSEKGSDGTRRSLLARRTPDKLLSTQSIVNQSTEISFSESSKPLSCSNKSTHYPSPGKQPLSKAPQDPRASHSTRYSSHKSLSKRVKALDASQTTDWEDSLCAKDPHSIERKKEWEEVRQVKFN